MFGVEYPRTPPPKSRPLAVSWPLAVLAMLMVGNIAPPVSGQSPPWDGSLVVDDYFLDILQAESHLTVSVTNTYFVNNTSGDYYDGPVFFSTHPGPQFISPWDGSPNRGCRYYQRTFLECFQIQSAGGGLYLIEPFGTQGLSYYGQTEGLSISATPAPNSSTAGASLGVDIVVGGRDRARTGGASGSGNLTLWSGYSALNLSHATRYSAERSLMNNLTFLVNNTGNTPEDVTLAGSGLPSGWTVEFLTNDTIVSGIRVPAGGSVEVTARLGSPAYRARIQVDYDAFLTRPDTTATNGSLHIPTVYPVEALESFVYNLTSDRLTVSRNMGLVHLIDSPPLRKRAIVDGSDLAANSTLSFHFNWMAPAQDGSGGPDILLLLALVAILVLAVVLVGVLLTRRRPAREGPIEAATVDDIERDLEPVQAPDAQATTAIDGEQAGRKSAREELKTVDAAMERLRSDRESGILPDDIYEKLEAEYKAKREGLLEAVAAEEAMDARGRELMEKKEKLLKALKGLREEHEQGKVQEEVFRTLEKEYKRSLVDIMKEMDSPRDRSDGPAL